MFIYACPVENALTILATIKYYVWFFIYLLASLNKGDQNVQDPVNFLDSIIGNKDAITTYFSKIMKKLLSN